MSNIKCYLSRIIGLIMRLRLYGTLLEGSMTGVLSQVISSYLGNPESDALLICAQ